MESETMHVTLARTHLLRALMAIDAGSSDDPDPGERMVRAATYAILAALELSQADSAVPAGISALVERASKATP